VGSLIFLISEIVLAAVAIAVLIFLHARNKKELNRLKAEKQQEARQIIKESELQRDNILKQGELEAKEKLLTITQEFERKTQKSRDELSELERKLLGREESLDRRSDKLERREAELEESKREFASLQQEFDNDRQRLDEMLTEQQRQLEKISGMSPQDAKRALMKSLENEARNESAKRIRQIEEQARETGLMRAKKIISAAIQRCGSEYVQETTVSVVDLPSDEMKGRIIGREGRNIRALEMATGVDLIIDDTPEAVILSGFDPYRREIARQSIEKLIADGRIHPARIEEVVEKIRAEIDQRLKEEGEEICFSLGIHDVHPELVKMLGKLKYRSSYGQNVLYHSREVAIIAGMMAAEVGANAQAAKRGGLFHDLGKAVDKETEGTHVEIGVKMLRKYGENEEVIHCVESHHFDTEPQTVEAVLVQSADSLSAARPGARREILETYVKRLEKLEELADGFKGVAKAYAIQAGREVRIIVESEKVTDEQMAWLAKDISKRIEDELEYPGEIKVTVIRETRSVEYAR
jgi:ribonucrease Y